MTSTFRMKALNKRTIHPSYYRSHENTKSFMFTGIEHCELKQCSTEISSKSLLNSVESGFHPRCALPAPYVLLVYGTLELADGRTAYLMVFYKK